MAWEFIKERLFPSPASDYEEMAEMSEEERKELEKGAMVRMCKKCGRWVPDCMRECCYCGARL